GLHGIGNPPDRAPIGRDDHLARGPAVDGPALALVGRRLGLLAGGQGQSDDQQSVPDPHGIASTRLSTRSTFASIQASTAHRARLPPEAEQRESPAAARPPPKTRTAQRPWIRRRPPPR